MDDPLQNMDDLTVSTLARGLALLVPLMPEGLELLLLFHGRDNFERFRAEIPCAVYQLPWLAPVGAGNPEGQTIKEKEGFMRGLSNELAVVCELNCRLQICLNQWDLIQLHHLELTILGGLVLAGVGISRHFKEKPRAY